MWFIKKLFGYNYSVFDGLIYLGWFFAVMQGARWILIPLVLLGLLLSSIAHTFEEVMDQRWPS